MKAFKEWFLYILTGSFVLAVTGAWIGLFFGILWKVFCWVIG